MLKIQKAAVRIRLDKRDAQLQFYEKFLSIYSKVARAWLRKAIRKPLLTMFSDSE